VIYLSETIDDFQTYFHPDKELNQIELGELLQKAVNFALPRLKEIEIDLKIELAKEIAIRTYVNEMIQVILNILNNAIDACITTKRKKSKITLSAQDLGELVEIEIKDDAGGISDEDLPHVFEPYFSTKGKNGTGLGLYMSQMIIQKQFDGVIVVDTNAKGSSFKVTIPKNVS